MKKISKLQTYQKWRQVQEWRQPQKKVRLEFLSFSSDSIFIQGHDTVVCGSVHTGSLIAHMFLEPHKETYLYFIKYSLHVAIPTSLRINENVHKCLGKKIQTKKDGYFSLNSPIL